MNNNTNLSKLAGKSPLTPIQEKPAETPGDTTKKPKGRTAKTTIYQTSEDRERMINALAGTWMHEEIETTSLSEFITSAAMEKVKELENKFNNGKPFPPAKMKKPPRFI